MECGINRLKRYRAVAAHFDKLAVRYLAVIRIDAQPPGRDDPTRRRYLCRTCGGGDFGTAELNAHTACVLSGNR